MKKSAVAALLLVILSMTPLSQAAETLVSLGSTWRYLDDGSDQNTGWRALTFDDSSWAAGPAVLGYGDEPPAATQLDFGGNTAAKYTTYYFRHVFNVADVSEFSSLALGLRRDDGAVVYLNGTEVTRQNMPGGPITYTTFAVSPVGGIEEGTLFPESPNPALLVEGDNILAVEVHQVNLTSSDLGFDLILEGTRSTGNMAPTVSITNPNNNDTFTAPATFTLMAMASDSDGTVASVGFYDGGVLLGTDSASPFTRNENGLGVGTHAYTAVATDDGGLMTTSSVVNVTIEAATAFSTNTIVSAGSVWKYLDDGSDQQTAWREPGFVDTGWASGPAELGYGDAPAVPEATLINSGPPGNFFITYYFRHNFTVADASLYSDLIGGLLADDGGVVYLNGTEVARINMPDGPITSSTRAPGSPSSETALVPFNINPALLVDGNNLLAVEVHQGAPNSSDVSFDLELLGVSGDAGPNDPPAVSITSPLNGAMFVAPADITVQAAATDDGTVVRVEFFDGGGSLGVDTSSPFSVTRSGVGAGNYVLRAVATDNNGLSSTSSVVNITVTGNMSPTVALTSPPNNSVFTAPTTITLEAVADDPDGTVAQVEFFAGAQSLGVDFAAPFSIDWNNSAVGNFSIRAEAMDDEGATAVSATRSISFEGAGPVSLVQFGAVWKYLDDGSDQGTEWKESVFDDSSWASGPGELGYGDNDEVTVLDFGGNSNNKHPAYYFRHTFNVADPSAFTFLTLDVKRDDGVILYINGIEVLRNNMPGGQVTHLTYASGNAAADGNVLVNATLNPGVLVAGDNVIAAEIHQDAPSSSDISFDISLIGESGVVQNDLPLVSISNPFNNAAFSEPASYSVIASASDADGNVVAVDIYEGTTLLVSDTSAPYQLDLSGVLVGEYFYRAVATDNFGARATSSVVHVSVAVPNPPTVQSQVPAPGAVGSLSQIVVTFSEAVLGVDASDLLINGQPATGMSGASAVYTFTFPEPAEGTVNISWASGHGILDFENPPQAFNAVGPGAAWQYALTDTVAPVVTRISPPPGSTITSLSEIEVTFSEDVTGVDAADLVVGGTPAAQVEGLGAGPYTFSFAIPATGAVLVSWVGGHGIQDRVASPNPFGGGSWSYNYDPGAIFEGTLVINEFMYHPASEDDAEEWIELFNRGAAAVDLTGWEFSRGVGYTFTNVTIGAGQYLVVAADPGRFSSLHPGVANVVGGWSGRLSNSDEDIELEDAQGGRVALVAYADEGNWGTRVRALVDGWDWESPADGGGRSMELMNPALPNGDGQNWSVSPANGGSPGVANGSASTDISPMILGVEHSPLVPLPTDTVTISAEIVDEAIGGVTVTLHWSDATVIPGAGFTGVPMFDDGLHNDGASGDGVYAGEIGAMPNGTLIDFYVSADDGTTPPRTWPAAARQGDGSFAQTANAVYQVDASVYSGRQPLVRLIMTAQERSNLNSARQRDDLSNATLLTTDAEGTKLRYNVGVRVRGNSSRGENPHNVRVNIPSDRRWNGVTAFNMNTKYTHSQLIGSVLSLKSGLAAAAGRAVQVRLNGVNEANSQGLQFGSYCLLEVINGEWAENHFPLDSEGNVYGARRGNTDFRYYGTDPGNYVGFFKRSNESQNDWTDLINMTFVLDNAAPATYIEQVSQVVNIDQWVNHFAVLALMGHGETSPVNGDPDDYDLYRGLNDPRFLLLPHDMDTQLGEGDGSAKPFNYGIYNMERLPILSTFMNHPVIRAKYHARLRELIATTYSPPRFDALIDDLLGGWVPQNVIDRMKQYVVNRNAFVLSILPPEVENPVAAISGEPPSLTYADDALLTVGGSDITHYRFRVNNGVYGPERPVSVPVSLSGLANGSYTVFVIGKNSGGTYQAEASATASDTWTVDAATAGLVINEVLAENNAAAEHEGTFPDMIELRNAGGSAVNLQGMRITDDLGNPNKFTFPNVSIGAGGYLVLYANNPDLTSGLHLGFSLDRSGEGVFLLESAADGGALVDSVVFGTQLTDLSAGRVEGARWALTSPSLGSANTAAPVGSGTALVINEWLAEGVAPLSGDFIEVYNPGALPVDMGGMFFTDKPLGYRNKSRVTDLTFVSAGGYIVFDADAQNGAGHVNFTLSPDQGDIALYDRRLAEIDCVIYTPQQVDVSQGRSPNGAETLAFFTTPTPGAGNPSVDAPIPPQLVNLIPAGQVWTYDDSGVDNGTGWREVAFDDSAWLSGAGVHSTFGETMPPGFTESTLLVPEFGKITFYFRTHFDFDSSLDVTRAELSHLVDDGAIFYLNGTEVLRYAMPPGPIDYLTLSGGGGEASLTTGTIPLEAFVDGDNVLAVEVHQNAPNSSDVVMGLRLDLIIVTNSPASADIMINEVLADNDAGEVDGSKPDWVELYNPSDSEVNVSDMSLTDDTATPRKWVLPVGSTIPAMGHLRIRCDASWPASATNTGFGLKASGDTLYLFNTLGAGGALRDSIAFGIQAADYSIGRVPDGTANWVVNIPTFGAANIATALGDPLRLKVNEWMADPGSGDDWFEIFNDNNQPVALGGLHLTDNLGNRTQHQIAALSFIGTGLNAFRKFAADDNLPAGADHTNFKLSAGGESVGLSDAAGVLIDSVTFGAQAEGISEGRLPDGDASITTFPGTETPGASNFRVIPGVVINEVLTHTDDPLEDAIELWNMSASPVDISGWYLSDSRRVLNKFEIPPATIMPPNSYRVFYETQFNSLPGDDFSFSLNSAKGDEIHLSATSGGSLTGFRTVQDFGAAENGVSIGRYLTSQGPHFVAMSRRTLGVDEPDTVQEFRLGMGLVNAAPLVGPVVISEVMYHPPDLIGPADNLRDEYIELHNITGSPVTLQSAAVPGNTWRLRDGVDFNFAQGTTIPGGGYLVVVSFDPVTDTASLGAFRAAYSLGTAVPIVGPFIGDLANNSDKVELYKPDLPQPGSGFVPYILVDKVNYGDVAPWPASPDGGGDSLHRISVDEYGNDPVNWQADSPSPGPVTGPVDGDFDGMPDEWETLHGFNPNDPSDAGLDADGDGVSNLGEYQSWTDPRDPDSVLRLLISDGTPVRLGFMAQMGHTYTIQVRSAVGSGIWSKLTDIPDGATRMVEVLDTPPGATRFYRLVTPAQ